MTDTVLQERIERHIERIPFSGCWFWVGYTLPNGYGKMSYKGRRAVFVHRMSFEAFVRPIGPGMKICHRCDIPCCVNPAHLFEGTQKENLNDMLTKMRSPIAFARLQTHCKRGHLLSGDNMRRNKYGSRQCLTCQKMMGKARDERRKNNT